MVIFFPVSFSRKIFLLTKHGKRYFFCNHFNIKYPKQMDPYSLVQGYY